MIFSSPWPKRQAVINHMHGNMMYLNVMNRLSVDCDCFATPSEPDMHDIGVLSSLDPVALDQACVDLIHVAPDGASVTERIATRHGEHAGVCRGWASARAPTV